VLTYKFLRGGLLRMHDISADGIFHLAILVLLKTRQTLIVFTDAHKGCRPVIQRTTSI